MASEAQLRISMQIRKGNLQYQNQPTSFNADVTGSKGPVPGAITVSTAGTSVDFSQLTQPGLCRIQNLDSTNYISVGMYVSGKFRPMIELLPGESWIFRLARSLGEEQDIPGTGTTGDIDTFMLRANTANCNALVEAFES